MADDRCKGLYDKYQVRRRDGSSRKGQKHARCDYFVLDWNHDPYAIIAARAYADACRSEFPALAATLRTRAQMAQMAWAPLHGIGCRSNECPGCHEDLMHPPTTERDGGAPEVPADIRSWEDLTTAIRAMPHEKAIGVLMGGASDEEWKRLAGMAVTLRTNPEQFVWDPARAHSATATSSPTTPTEPPPTAGGDLGADVLAETKANVERVAAFFDRYYEPDGRSGRWLDSCGPAVDLLSALREARAASPPGDAGRGRTAEDGCRFCGHGRPDNQPLDLVSASLCKPGVFDALCLELVSDGRTEERADVVAWMEESERQERSARDHGAQSRLQHQVERHGGAALALKAAATAIKRGDHIGAGAPRKEG